MDAFASALNEAAHLSEREHGRLPELAELAGAFESALIAAGYPAAEVRAKLEPLHVPSIPRARPDVPARRAGQVLRVPYAGGGSKAVYGRVLHVPDAASTDRRVCIVILDRDVEPGIELAELPDAEWLVGPIGVDELGFRRGDLEIIGETPLRGRERALPTYELYTGRGPMLVDYFGAPIEDTPEARSRCMLERDGEIDALVRTIRAQRYLTRGPDDFIAYLPPPSYGR
jgi:hypothetical protein